jgi:hypothetical protein
MPTDIRVRRRLIEQVVSGIADEGMQRRAWFGIGSEESSPDEEFNQFFSDAAVDEFLARNDTGLNEAQMKSGKRLVAMMRKLSDQTSSHMKPEDLIDDPRWQKIRKAAAEFSALLTARSASRVAARRPIVS